MKYRCPECGSIKSKRQSGGQRVCQECGTRFTPPTPFWERLVFSLVFLVPGLVFGIVAVAMARMAQEVHAADGAGTFAGFGSVAALVALVCLGQGIRELIGPIEASSTAPADDLPDEAPEAELPQVLSCPPLVPEEEAEALVREIAQKHGAKRILRLLGHLPPEQVENAVAHFAKQLDDDETPLAQIDTSFLRNGKAGFLLTNRGLYSSFYSRPLWLADIHEVSFARPGFGDYGIVWLFTGIIVLLACGLGGTFGTIAKIPISLVFLFYTFSRFRKLQYRLLVNGKMVYAGANRLLGPFWVELLMDLADAARHLQITGGERKRRPRLVVLETALRVQEDADELRQIRSPSWQDVEQSIRALDQDSHPSLRIWAGEVEQAPALEILGGNGKYVLRELDDGWTYYDPSAGEEEVEVCKGGSAHRAPAFYVCTDLSRVLEIARRYVETGTPE